MNKKEKEIFSKKNLALFGQGYVRELTLQIKKAGKNSSGNLIKSIDYRVQVTAEEIRILVESEDYLTYIDEGRKPGSYPDMNAISRWANLKGIPQTAVFPIARNIFKFGIKPTNIIDNTITQIMNNKNEEKIMEEELVKNTENMIHDTFTKNK